MGNLVLVLSLRGREILGVVLMISTSFSHQL